MLKALQQRDAFYHKVGIAHTKINFNLLLTKKGGYALEKKLTTHQVPLNIWYNVLSGVVQLKRSEEKAKAFFQKALTLADNNPGSLLVLFFEFQEFKLAHWSEQALMKLEKEYLAMGGQSAALVAQQLLTESKFAVSNENIPESNKLLNWSAQFERYPLWQTYLEGAKKIFQDPIHFFAGVKRSLSMTKYSWFLQLKLLYFLYSWFIYALLFYIGVIFIAFSFQKLPAALHPFACMLPQSLPSPLRLFFCLAVYFSFISFGILFFLLMTAIIIWPYIKKKNRYVLLSAIAILLLSPINARINDAFSASLSDNQPLGILRRALSEGWHEDLELQIIDEVEKDDANLLNHISAAVINLKKNNPVAAVFHAKYYEDMQQKDPVALITAGNIYNYIDNSEKAKSYYQTCLHTFPANSFALFNLGQLNHHLMNILEGSEQIEKAAEANPFLVNTYIEKNARYFTDSLPPLRQFMQPDYTPGYFWIHIFPKNCGSWKSAEAIWGTTFFGMPPLIFLFISPILLLFFILYKNNKTNHHITYCKLCGKAVCPKCQKGSLCNGCAVEIERRNTNEKKHNKNRKTVNSTRMITTIVTISLNIAFPGLGHLYRKEAFSWGITIRIIASIIIYASYAMLLTFSMTYPFWVIKDTVTVLLIGLLMYNVFYTISLVRHSNIEHDAVEESYVT